MKKFQIVPQIVEYESFAEFAADAMLGSGDLILTNAYIYQPVIAPLGLGCQTLFQELYGAGEPTDVMIDSILQELSGKEFKRIIAVGGGTILDIAKVLAVSGGGKTVDDLYENMAVLNQVYPLILVPTTCGTGSEATNISIISRTAKGVKQGLVSPALFAGQAVLIPEMLSSLPYVVFAASSIDAMIHAAESYLSPNASPLSELFSEKALELILPCWRAAVDSGEADGWKQYRAAFLRASNYAGIAFGHAGCAAVHALSYPLGAVHHVPHGEANQCMFASVMRRYAEKQPDGRIKQFEQMLAKLLGCEPEQALEALCSLMDCVLVRKPMRAYGVTEAELPHYADTVIETQQRLLRNNYVSLERDEILTIYKNAF